MGDVSGARDQVTKHAASSARRAPAVSLAEFATTMSGGTPSRNHPEYFNGGIPWVKSAELRDAVIDETAETLSEEGLAASSARIFPGRLAAHCPVWSNSRARWHTRT